MKSDFIMQVCLLTTRWCSLHFKRGFVRGKVQHTSSGRKHRSISEKCQHMCPFRGGSIVFYNKKGMMLITFAYRVINVNRLHYTDSSTSYINKDTVSTVYAQHISIMNHLCMNSYLLFTQCLFLYVTV